jgi:hypothetical protein
MVQMARIVARLAAGREGERAVDLVTDSAHIYQNVKTPK